MKSLSSQKRGELAILIQFEIFEIIKLLKYKENNKKICNTFDQ